VEKVYGYTSNEVLAGGHEIWFGRIHPDDRAHVQEAFRSLFDHKIQFNVEYRIQRKDGQWIWVQDRANIVEEKAGEYLAYGLFSDITGRKRAEEALRESKERLRAILEANPDPVVMYDTEGHPQYLNPAFTKVLGWTIDDLRGQRIPFVPNNQKEITAAKIKEFYASGKTSRIETQRLTKQGDTIDVILSAAGIKGPKGNIVGLVVNMTDITEKKKIENQLQRSQKMESLGLLASGVAHDLNNVLSGIVSYPELLLLDLPKDSNLRKPIETIHESGHRAVAIVQDLLTVARGVATTKQPLNLNALVGDYLNSPEFEDLQHFHSAVKVKTNLYGDLFNIGGSHVHIRKVVMNLVSNASEAIDGSGNVAISTMNRYVDRPLRGYDDVNIGEYAILSVSDDGPGISSDDLERIFEPFYTKKVMGRSGTGLGLAVVWNVIQEHKGYINVTSDENGTTFELYFPITRGEVSGKDLSVPFKDLKGNGEKILVIDDVESQRDISCKMLDTLGYKTQAVSGGEEAVEYLKENTVDLILLDMIMEPGINGRETFERIIRVHPKQKAIVVSGFAETDEVKKTQKLGAGKFIKKPLTLESIGLAVKEEMEK
jgi:PAS domain S-box-containing protein